MVTETQLEDAFNRYEAAFGRWMFPPLDYGHVHLSDEQLMAYLEKAIARNRAIDWAEELKPLPPGALS
jgi:trehalose-6-phosphate synthase